MGVNVYVLLLGAPGAGKGTQAAMLSRELGLAHVASGDLFREAAKQGTELGLLAKSYMDKGELVPDEVTIAMVMERLERADCAQGVILDGFPRTLEQAKALYHALGAMGKAIDKVLYIKATDAELIRRLSGRRICRSCQASYHESSKPPKVGGKCDECGGELYQRSDDSVETAKNRLKVYFAQTSPLIDYYRGAGILEEVDGELGIEGVQQELLAALR